MDMMHAKNKLYVKLHAGINLRVKLHAGHGGLGKAHLDYYDVQGFFNKLSELCTKQQDTSQLGMQRQAHGGHGC